MSSQNRTLQGDELAKMLRRRGAHDSELRVVAPIVVSRTLYLASDDGLVVLALGSTG